MLYFKIRRYSEHSYASLKAWHLSVRFLCKEDNFIVTTGAGDYSRKCSVGRQRKKTYKLNKLTPKLLDEIVDKVLPKMYSGVEKAIKLYKEKNKLKEIEKDFEP